MANLIEQDFEGFEEDDSALYAFAPAEPNVIETATRIGKAFGVEEVMHELIPEQNWNAQWESDFAPVVVGEFCTIRAHFHEIDIATQHEVVITPKMSFGTGHHDTTRLMIAQMQDVPFVGKKVLDFGTGTGVLAILAAKLGAESIDAVDNDSWAYENSLENVAANGVSGINVIHGTLSSVPEGQYDLILANINRHILLDTMTDLYQKLMPTGRIFMSGLLLQDEGIICEAAASVGFVLTDKKVGNNWLLLEFIKEL